jgi:Protein of unknown function (DUF721).
MLPVGSALEHFFKFRGGAAVFERMRLWRQWEEAVGQDIASLGQPLGSRDSVLEVMAYDSMAMQDLKMQADILLERANTLMGGNPLTAVTFSLPDSRKPLSLPPQRPPMPPAPPKPEFVPPEGFGKIAHLLDPNSTVGRCYHAVYALYEKQK